MEAPASAEGTEAQVEENGDAAMVSAEEAGDSAPPPPPHPESATGEAAAAPAENGTNTDPATEGMESTAAPPAASEPATAGMSTTRPRSPPPPAETDEQRAEKRQKLEGLKREARQRGNRMFGMMLGTLQRAKKEVRKVEETDAGRKRAELEGKLSERLREERREAQEKERRERELREVKNEVHRREDNLAHAEAIVSDKSTVSTARALTNDRARAVPHAAQRQTRPRRLPLHDLRPFLSANHHRLDLDPLHAPPPPRDEADRPARRPPNLLPPPPPAPLARRPDRRSDFGCEEGYPKGQGRLGRSEEGKGGEVGGGQEEEERVGG